VRELRAPATVALGGDGYDHGYDALADGAVFGAAGRGRRIAVRVAAGYPAAQIYSPPGAQFICYEPMTGPTDALRSGDGLRLVAPGETFRAVFAIEVADGQPG
jgi:aldose 1-epimerase